MDVMRADLESLLSSLVDEVIDGNADEGLWLLTDLGGAESMNAADD